MHFFKQATPALPSKRVTFSRTASVILGPCRAEYTEAKLSSALWYSQDDLAAQKAELLSLVNAFIEEQAEKGFVITMREALCAFKDPYVSLSDHIELLERPELVRGAPVLDRYNPK